MLGNNSCCCLRSKLFGKSGSCHLIQPLVLWMKKFKEQGCDFMHRTMPGHGHFWAEAHTTAVTGTVRLICVCYCCAGTTVSVRAFRR